MLSAFHRAISSHHTRGTAPAPKASNGLGLELDDDDGSPFPAQCTFDIVEEFAYARHTRARIACTPRIMARTALCMARTATRHADAPRVPSSLPSQAHAGDRVPTHPRVHGAATLQVQAVAMAVPRPGRDHVHVRRQAAHPPVAGGGAPQLAPRRRKAERRERAARERCSLRCEWHTQRSHSAPPNGGPPNWPLLN